MATHVKLNVYNTQSSSSSQVSLYAYLVHVSYSLIATILTHWMQRTCDAYTMYDMHVYYPSLLTLCPLILAIYQILYYIHYCILCLYHTMLYFTIHHMYRTPLHILYYIH